MLGQLRVDPEAAGWQRLKQGQWFLLRDVASGLTELGSAIATSQADGTRTAQDIFPSSRQACAATPSLWVPSFLDSILTSRVLAKGGGPCGIGTWRAPNLSHYPPHPQQVIA